MIDPKVAWRLHDQGFEQLRTVQNQIIGINKFAFTWGVVINIDNVGYERRYCFQHRADAQSCFDSIVDVGEHPIGPWIKCKGLYRGQMVDILNPEWSNSK